MSSRDNPDGLSYRAERFLAAHRSSPLVYQSASSDDDVITFRLADEQKFELTTAEAQSIARAGVPLRWAHLESRAS